MAVKTSYYERTIQSIVAQCESRNLTAEQKTAFKSAVETRYGKKLIDLDESDLKRLNRDLPNLLSAFLGGVKRSGDVPATPREEWDPEA